MISAIVTHYIDVGLNQFDPFLFKIGTLSIVDLILIPIGVTGCGIIIYDVLKRVRTKIRAPTEQRQRQLTQHCNTLIMEYNRYISDYIKIADISLEEYLSCFRYWRQFRQHLYTGHRELYNLIGQNNYRLFIERMGEDLLNGIALGTQAFGGACVDCLNLHYEREIPQLQLLLNQLH